MKNFLTAIVIFFGAGMLLSACADDFAGADANSSETVQTVAGFENAETGEGEDMGNGCCDDEGDNGGGSLLPGAGHNTAEDE